MLASSSFLCTSFLTLLQWLWCILICHPKMRKMQTKSPATFTPFPEFSSSIRARQFRAIPSVTALLQTLTDWHGSYHWPKKRPLRSWSKQWRYLETREEVTSILLTRSYLWTTEGATATLVSIVFLIWALPSLHFLTVLSLSLSLSLSLKSQSSGIILFEVVHVALTEGTF